jgi:hypothetical protein
VTKVKSIYPVSNPAHQPTKQATTTTMRFWWTRSSHNFFYYHLSPFIALQQHTSLSTCLSILESTDLDVLAGE